MSLESSVVLWICLANLLGGKRSVQVPYLPWAERSHSSRVQHRRPTRFKGLWQDLDKGLLWFCPSERRCLRFCPGPATVETLELSLLGGSFAKEFRSPLFINVLRSFLVTRPTRHTSFAIISVYLEFLKDTSSNVISLWIQECRPDPRLVIKGPPGQRAGARPVSWGRPESVPLCLQQTLHFEHGSQYRDYSRTCSWLPNVFLGQLCFLMAFQICSWHQGLLQVPTMPQPVNKQGWRFPIKGVTLQFPPPFLLALSKVVNGTCPCTFFLFVQA